MKLLFFAFILFWGFTHLGFNTTATAQTWVLRKHFGGNNNDYNSRILFDKEDNMYVVGEFRDLIQFDTIKLQATNWSVYAAKYNTKGDIVWARKIAATSSATSDIYGSALVIDHENNLLVAGSFSEAATFADTSIQSVGSTDIYVLKLHNDGSQIWVKRAGGNGLGTFGQDAAYAIALDNSNNCYITGRYNHDATFDDITISSSQVVESFAAKFSSDGKALWAKSATGGTSIQTMGQAIAVDNEGNCYFTGTFFSKITFGDFPIDAGDAEQKMYLVKVNPSGTVLWAKRVGSGGYYGAGLDMAIDQNGNCFIAGYFRADLHFGDKTFYSNGTDYSGIVLKYDKNGNELWANSTGSEHQGTRVQRISLDKYGNAFITGSFSHIATFGSITLHNDREVTNPFIAQLDAQGNFIWAEHLDCNNGSAGSGISVSDDGYCAIAGTFQGAISLGSEKVTGIGAQDVFVGKLQLNTAAVHEPEKQERPGVLFYPNPAIDHITISSQYAHSGITILSPSGIEQIHATSCSGINLSNLPTGIFYVKAGLNVQKLIKLAN